MDIGYLAIVPILAFLIVIHELGHFWAARSVGVTVEEFGLGIPPRVAGWRRNGVLWSINALPIGGFVRVKGEDVNDREPGSMQVAGPWQRGWFLIAGPLMNLLAALIISGILVGTQGLPSEHPYIGMVEPNSPAQEAGWQPGDRIVSINGEEMGNTQDTIDYVRSHTGEEITVVIQRGNEQLTTTVTPRENPPAGQGSTGISFGNGQLSDVRANAVAPGSIAAEAGMQEGDRIIRINGIEIEAMAQAVGIMDSHTGQEVSITYLRDGQEHTAKVSVPTPSLAIREDVASDSPASRAALYKTDEITRINGEQVTTGQAFISTLVDQSGQEIELEYNRITDDGPVPMTATMQLPDLTEIDRSQVLPTLGLGLTQPSAFRSIGITPVGHLTFVPVQASRIIPESWNQFTGVIGGTVTGLQQLFSGQAGVDNLMGPIGMAQATGQLLDQTAGNPIPLLLQLTMFISISLGLLNLLPIPALDGGRLLFVIVEILRGGKRVPPEKEGAVHMVGMLMLLGLIAFIAFGDISRILNGESIFR